MNYWRILERADQALAGDDFVTAEQLLVEARLTRDESGGRVFWTERLADGMRRLLHGITDRGDRTPPAGRWPAAVAGLQTRFRERADATVREAVRLADLRPEAREMFRLLVKEEVGRKGLIEHYGLNKNTLDTRLHVFRRELKNLLRKRGLGS